MEVEGKLSQVLLDSCSSTNIISETFLINHLRKNRSQLHGPIGCVLGLGNSLTYDLGRINLKLKVLDREYIEEFIVITEPGLPGDILLSAEAMGRCGLNVNFRKRRIVSEDSKQEVTFCLEEKDVPVNRARLHVTCTSEQEATTSKAKIKPDDHHQNFQVSALQNHKLNQPVISSTNEHLLKDQGINPNPTSVNNIKSSTNTNNKITQVNKNSYEQSSVINRIMNQVSMEAERSKYHLETRGTSMLSNVVSNHNQNNHNQISNSAEDRTIKQLLNTSNNTCYLVSKHENQPLTEVLYSGSIKRTQLQEELEEQTMGENNKVECVYFAEQTDSDEIHCISTNDDYQVAFKVNQEIVLTPNNITKVHYFNSPG